MPFFPEDIKATLTKAADGPMIRRIFNSPFVSAGLFTVCVFITLVLISTTINIKEITRVSLIVYVLSVSMMFFNNRVLMHQMATITGGAHEITPVRDVVPTGAFAPYNAVAAPYNGEVAPVVGAGESAINNYPADFLDQ